MAADIDIRRQEPQDYEGLAALLSLPGVMHGTLQLPYPSVERWRQRLLSPNPTDYQLVAVHGDLIVGSAGLNPETRPRRNHVGSIGMAVHDDWQGQGIGRRLLDALMEVADGWLGLTRIELTVFTDNARAIRLYEQCGFVQEGVHRQYARRDGVLVDAYAMARVK